MCLSVCVCVCGILCVKSERDGIKEQDNVDDGDEEWDLYENNNNNKTSTNLPNCYFYFIAPYVTTWFSKLISKLFLQFN